MCALSAVRRVVIQDGGSLCLFLIFAFDILHPVGEVSFFTLLKASSVHCSGGDEESNGNVSHGDLCRGRVSIRQLTISS